MRTRALAALGAAGIGIIAAALSGLLPTALNVGSVGEGAILVAVVGIVAYGIVGLTLLVRVTDNRAPIAIPTTAPGNFRFINEAEGALRRRELPAFTLAEGLLLRLRRKLGGRAGYGTPAEHELARNTFDRIQYAMGGAILALILFPLLGAFTFSRIGTAFGLVTGGALAALLIVWAVQQGRVLKAIFPAHGPEAEVEERIQTIHGGGDPFVLASELEQRMMVMRLNNQPNRTTRRGWAQTVNTVSDAGRVDGTLLIETQPIPGRYDPPQIADDFLRRGTLLQTVAPFLVCITLPWVPGPIQMILALGGLTLAWIGHADLQGYKLLAERVAWESTIVYVEMEGSVGKTEVRAGRAHTDSFESSNTVIRSDCQMRLFAASIISQGTQVDGERFIVRLRRDARAEEAVNIMVSAIEDFEKKGVRIRGIDLENDAIQSTFKANVLAEGAKAATRREAELPPPAVKPLVSLIEKTDAHDEWREAPVRRLVCPSCQAVVEVVQGARPLCSACGYSTARSPS